MKISAKFKTLSITLIAVIFTTTASAQTTTEENKATNYDQGFRLGFGVSGGYVFDDPYEFALGGDVRLQYDLSKRNSLTLTTGFTNLFVDGENNDLGFIPVKAGFKGFVWGDRFYVMGEAGAAFAVTNDYDKTSLILSPSIGFANDFIDISVRYEYYNDFPVLKNGGAVGEGIGQLGLRLAYGFKI
jgi:hypothetical protein